MTGFWKRGDELERKLRAERPEPRSEFVHALADHVLSRRYRASSRLRVVFAGAITTAVVVSLSAFGGLGYAASAAKHAADQAQAVVNGVSHDEGQGNKHDEGQGNKHDDAQDNNSDEDDSVSSAQGQYDKKVTICHHTGSGKNVTITISVNALPAHLAHGDTIGPC
jgi:hypothetical protein